MNKINKGLSNFLGQKEIIKRLQIYISASKKRGTILEHVLLYGPPGLGKTSIAKKIAEELNKKIHIINGATIENISDLVVVVNQISEGDILFIDEIHRIPINVEEFMYTLIEDFYMNIMIGEFQNRKSINISVPKFTLVGATTKIGSISKPLRDRFTIIEQLRFYTLEELTEIIKEYLNGLDIFFENKALLLVASVGRGTPRITLNILKKILSFVFEKDLRKVDEKFCLKCLNELGIKKHGLELLEIQYLTFLRKSNGRPIGLDTIATNLNEDYNTIEDYIEPYLIRMNLVQRTSRGRILTEYGLEYLNEMDE